VCVRIGWILGLTFLVAGPSFARDPVRVIYETDMESDIDDVAGLAMLHALADKGECELLAVMHNTSDPYSVGVIDAVNTYYGRPDLPIGCYKSDDARSDHFGGAVHYTEQIAKDARFPKDVVTHDDVPDAVTLYKELLAKQPDQSVTIVSVGWTTNLRNLLLDSQGAELVKTKVRLLSLMGGGWDPPDVPHRAAMNLAGNQVVSAAFEAGRYVVEHWPTPIVFSGITIGGRVATGEGLKKTPRLNPVREAYRINKAHNGLENWNHPSWDQTAILFAVRGKQSLWTLNTQGTPRMFLKPNIQQRYLRWYTLWDSHVDSPHAYLRFATGPEPVAAQIESLMTQPRGVGRRKAEGGRRKEEG